MSFFWSIPGHSPGTDSGVSPGIYHFTWVVLYRIWQVFWLTDHWNGLRLPTTIFNGVAVTWVQTFSPFTAAGPFRIFTGFPF